MNKILHFIFKILKKYDSLREEAWTHFLVLFTYIFAIATMHNTITTPNDSGAGISFLVYLTKTVPFYLVFTGLALTMGFYNIFQKDKIDKIKNKFLTQNIFYAIYWNIGIIIFLYFMGILIYFIISVRNC